MCRIKIAAMSDISETSSGTSGAFLGSGPVEAYSAPITTVRLDGTNFLT